MVQGEGGEFKNFPMSLAMLMKVQEYRKILSIPLLRLGAQETLARWIGMSEESHEQHMKNVGYRAVLQSFADKQNIKLKKKKRKGVSQNGFKSFGTLLEELPERYELSGEVVENLSLMNTLNEENVGDFPKYELLTGLQFLLQSVIENLIILDRVQYLK